MAEFTEVMKQKNRMTKECEISCLECNLGSENNGMKLNCYRLLINHPDVYEKIVMDWAKEHPVITNADKFKEVFGFEHHSTCPMYRKECCYIKNGCCGCEYDGFWQQEYKEQKEKVE